MLLPLSKTKCSWPHTPWHRETISESIEPSRGSLQGTGGTCPCSLGFKVSKSVVQIRARKSDGLEPSSPMTRGTWLGTLGSEGGATWLLGPLVRVQMCFVFITHIWRSGVCYQDGLINNKKEGISKFLIPFAPALQESIIKELIRDCQISIFKDVHCSTVILLWRGREKNKRKQLRCTTKRDQENHGRSG